MVTPEYVLTGVLLPAVTAGLLLALPWRAWKRKEDSGRPAPFAGALALGLAFLIGTWAVSGFPPLPFGDRRLSGLEWLTWFAVLATPVFALEQTLGKARAFVRGLLSTVLLERVLSSMTRNHWEGMTAVYWIAGLLLLLAVSWLATEQLALRTKSATTPLVLWMTATGLALCAGLTGSAKIAQLTGGLCAGLGAAVVVSLWAPRVSLQRGGASLAVTVLFGLGLCAHFYSDLPGLDALLLAAAPLCAWLAPRIAARSGSPKAQTIARLAGALIPVAIAVTRAVLAFEPDPYGYDY